MKELSVEEKAKRYDEAIEIARQIHDADRVSGIELTTCEEIFPELKGSEDKRIRKALINGFNKLDKSAVWYNGITNGQILAWLEKQGLENDIKEDAIHLCNELIDTINKQGEQKPAWSEEDDYNLQCMIAKVASDIQKGNVGRNNELIDWLKSLKERMKGE